MTTYWALFILFTIAWAKEAILLGSSGLVGGLVLQELLASPDWTTIHVIVRKPLKVQHEKINQLVITDLTQMAADSQLQTLVRTKYNQIDAAVVTLGVNEPFGWTAQQLWDVEVTLTSLFASVCHSQLGVKYISLLTGVDSERGYVLSPEDLATELSWWNLYWFFTKIKGNVEDAVVQSGITYQSFFRPANFETDEYRYGVMDVLLQWISSALNFVVPSKYHSIHAKDIARAMFADMDAATTELMDSSALAQKESIKRYDDMIVLVEQKMEL